MKPVSEPVKQRLYAVLEGGGADAASRAVGVSLMTLIVLNVLSVVLETVESLQVAYGGLFRAFEVFSVVVFSAEYVLRMWSCTADERYARPVWGRLRFMLGPLALVDLAAILPFYLPLVMRLDLRVMRAVRLVRLFRILKMGRYSEALGVFRKIFWSKKEELLITVFAAGVMLVLVSSLMFFIENEAQPKVFSSIPAAMWWGVATLTTVGYGDIYPITTAGKILGTLSAVFGIGMFALPAGILGSAFVEEMHRRREKSKICPHCGKEIEE
ncbi:MAG TPA: ion transporter [Elusimicrobiota bacterium]|nr:ion transporter [Elusimicrobiota bacterium]